MFGFDPLRPPPGRYALVDGLPHLLAAEAAAQAVALAADFDLVWCTGWEDRADDHLPALLGLPRGRPHLRFAQTTLTDTTATATEPTATDAPTRHWKLAAIEAYAGPDRPLAWIDDDHDDSCRTWARARRGPTLLLTTDPAVGLTRQEAARLRAWAAQAAP